MKPKKPMLTTPNGGVAHRCQAKNRRAEQCGRPARSGFTVCGHHGAGYAKREDEGEKRPVGRPATHGLYSRTTLRNLADLREEVAALELDLNNSDGEMTTLKAVVWHLLNQAQKMNAKADTLEAAVDAVEATLEAAVVIKDGEPGDGELTTTQARQVAAGLAQGHKLLSAISSWTDRLLEANVKTISAVKTRAEIRARLAEEEAVQHFVELVKKIAVVIWSLSPDDAFLDAYEARLDRDVFAPMGLKLPAAPAE